MRRALATLLLLFPLSAAAHDYWLAPERFALQLGQPLTIDLRLGGHFVAEESRPYQPSRTESFVLVNGRGTVDLKPHAVDGSTPVVDGVVVDAPGPALIGMERDWIDIKLPDDRFTSYLKHEGLTEIMALRDREGHRATERECYTRGLKSLVRVGDAEGPPVHAKVLGHRLEIVLLDDPHRLGPAGELRAKVLHRGQPLVGAQVTAHHRPGPDRGKVTTYTADTDDAGIARFTVDPPGAWLLRMVHMVPCKECSYTDWESYWTSFSFVRGDMRGSKRSGSKR